jgi:medium-chain acyl-[acyl-carrier-protein] hydrolase
MLTCLTPNPAAVLRLLCFPHAGSGPAGFRGWAEALAPDIEVWTVILPGRPGRPGEPPAREWEPLARDLAASLQHTVAPPYALFGHSLGALLAFEVARQLFRRGGLPPTHLVVSARGAPDVHQRFEVPVSDDALLARVESRYGKMPSLIRDDRDVLTVFLPALRADLELADAYVFRPGTRLRCPITAISGEHDHTVTDEQARRWARHTSAVFTSYRLPAGHFYGAGQLNRVFEILRRRLAGSACSAPTREATR